LVKSF